MHAWLVINGFLQTDKFIEINNWLVNSARKNGISVSIYKNTEFFSIEQIIHSDRPDFVIFWDKDIRLATQLEAHGLRLFNRASAIADCDDKSLTYLRLSPHGISMPMTLIAPMTFSGVGYTDYSFLDSVEATLGYPFVIKEAFGSFGAQVYLSHSREETITVLEHTDCRPVIFQEFIAESFGRDIRINVVGGEPVAAMMRHNPDDFRANITNGGTMSLYNPTKDQTELALKACRYLNLDFAGVDILFGKDDHPLLCEVNSNAHFKSIFECTGINVADLLIKHILKEVSV